MKEKKEMKFDIPEDTLVLTFHSTESKSDSRTYVLFACKHCKRVKKATMQDYHNAVQRKKIIPTLCVYDRKVMRLISIPIIEAPIIEIPKSEEKQEKEGYINGFKIKVK